MSSKSYPGHVDEENPELFDIRAMPSQPTELKLGQLPAETIKRFFEDGFIIIKDFFKPEELNPVRDAIDGLVEDLAQKLYKAGKIKELFSEYGLFQRLIKIDEAFPGANIILHKTGNLPQAFRDLWSNERLLNIIEQLIGPDIAGSPVWNLRTKTPKNEATLVPWHQDSAYFDNESYKVLIPSAWIPLLDTNEFNGGMEMVKKAHAKGKVGTHTCCYGNTWYVMMEEEEMSKTLDVDIEKESQKCEVPYGGLILFNNMTPHRSLPNVSKDIRWSLDLRWQRPDAPFGLWNLKPGVVMRSSTDPELKPDWDTFCSIDRTAAQKESIKDFVEVPDDEFDTTIQGPWMKKWEIVHMNAHTDKHEEVERTKS
ncbi:uncharacterized protein LOC134705499 [Mytilus trossulus]|uniref:uncharacterized protein LOC134705499 n=1 Tax=Mytilus trossulus TaxID=6551 RepID=UPI0030069312